MRILAKAVATTALAIGTVGLGVPAATAALADGPTPRSTVQQLEAEPWPYLQEGDRGRDVQAVQNLLLGSDIDHGDLVASGAYGPETTQVMKNYQRAEGLRVTGTGNANTLGHMSDTILVTNQTSNEGYVEGVQAELVKVGYAVDIDGQFGSETEQAVRDYQKKSGIGVDGKVGPYTWEALFKQAGDN